MTTFNSVAYIKQKCCVPCVSGKNDKRALYIASSGSCQPSEVERKYIQEQEPNQSQSYSQNMSSVKRTDQNVTKRRIGIEWNNGGGTRLFQW